MTGGVDTMARRLARRLARRRDIDTTSPVEAGWQIMAQANRIFGPLGWSREIIELRNAANREREGVHTSAYVARIRIRVETPSGPVTREGQGCAEGRGQTPFEAHDAGIKRAELDATLRTLATFGRALGLAGLAGEPRKGKRTRRPAATPPGRDTEADPASPEPPADRNGAWPADRQEEQRTDPRGERPADRALDRNGARPVERPAGQPGERQADRREEQRTDPRGEPSAYRSPSPPPAASSGTSRPAAHATGRPAAESQAEREQDGPSQGRSSHPASGSTGLHGDIAHAGPHRPDRPMAGGRITRHAAPGQERPS